MKKDSSSPFHLRGKPGRLSTVLRLPSGASKYSGAGEACVVDLPGVDLHAVRLRELDETAPGSLLLKIKLPRSTPPGAYKGTVTIDGNNFPIQVDVEPRIRLRLFPSRLTAEAVPGAALDFQLAVLNKGNTEFNLEQEYRFCVFERGAVDRALFVALANDNGSDRRLDRLMDELANSHGGRVRLGTRDGAGPIAPGQMREAAMTLRLSDRLRPGRTYTGAWKIEKTSFNVEIRVVGDAKETKK